MAHYISLACGRNQFPPTHRGTGVSKKDIDIRRLHLGRTSRRVMTGIPGMLTGAVDRLTGTNQETRQIRSVAAHKRVVS